MNIRISEEIEVEVWQVERPPEIKPPKKDAFNLKFTKHIKTRSTSLNLFVESHHHLSINTDTLQIKSVAAYMKRYLCVCIPWLCFYVFVCAGVCFKASGGKQKKEMGKKSYKRKEIKNYKVCSNIQEPHSCSCREGSVRTCVSNITARAANETKERSKRCVITRLFYLLGSLISGQAKSVLTRDRPPNRSNCWTMKRKSYFLSLASHTRRKNVWTHSFRLPVMKSTLRFKKSWTRFTSQTLCASAAVISLIGYKLTSSRLW